jgi:hypothetical protein
MRINALNGTVPDAVVVIGKFVDADQHGGQQGGIYMHGKRKDTE